eukprot:3637928-Pyramimonas_sp.AAC.1
MPSLISTIRLARLADAVGFGHLPAPLPPIVSRLRPAAAKPLGAPTLSPAKPWPALPQIRALVGTGSQDAPLTTWIMGWTPMRATRPPGPRRMMLGAPTAST